MKLGARFESFGLPFRPMLAAAAKLRLSGIQFDGVFDLSPSNLGETGRKEIQHLLRSHGLQLTAINCPLRHGLDSPTDLQPRLERILAAMSLSFDLGARLIIVPAPKLTIENDPRRATLIESLTALTNHGGRIGTAIALDMGLDNAEPMCELLAPFDLALGVNYDPANMLAHGYDPVANLLPLKDRLIHTHARDVRIASSSRGPVDVPIGQGDVEWMGYLGTLSACEFNGWIVIDSSDANPEGVEEGARFLRRLL